MSLSKLMSISSLHFIDLTCSKLITSPNSITLYTISITSNHSRIPSISPATINLQIPSGIQLSHSAPNFVSSFHKFVLISISNNIWDPLKLLLLSCDDQTNLGLQPTDENIVFWSICSPKINRGIQQDMVLTCSNSNCNRLSSILQWPINLPNSPQKNLWTYYHMKMSITYPTSSSFWVSKSSFCRR